MRKILTILLLAFCILIINGTNSLHSETHKNFNIGSMRYLTLSPDGSQIAFLGRRKDTCENKFCLWKLRINDSQSLQSICSEGEYRLGSPAYFSSDGKAFAYTTIVFHQETMTSQIIIERIGGDGKNIIKTVAGSPLEIKWNPKGDIIGYSRASKERKIFIGLVSVNADIDREVNLGESSIAYISRGSWDFSPDGNSIYVILKDGIWEIGINDSVKKKIIDSIGYSLSCSSDNEKIIFTSYGLWLFDVNQRKLKKIVAHQDVTLCLWEKPWSPDNTKICYEAKKNNYWHIFVKNVDGPNVQVTKEKNHDRFPYWLSNNEIIFIRDESSIWVVNSGGTNPHQIFPRPEK